MRIFSKLFLSTSLVMAASTLSNEAEATDRYLGDVVPVGFNFCPRGTADAAGQLLPINSNQSLYSILGTTYGGDGRTTFALPDMRGRLAVHVGSGPGLTTRSIGQKFGTETNTLSVNNIPSHTHRMAIQTNSDEVGNSNKPRGNSFSTSSQNQFDSNATLTSKFMNGATVTVQSSGQASPQAQNNIMPTLAIKYCVVTQGLFPPRN